MATSAPSNSRHNETAVRQSLQSMLKSLSSAEHISYFEFLVIARQLNFRFESPESLSKLKNFFEKSGDKIEKSLFMSIIDFKGFHIVNNTKMQLISVKDPHPHEKVKALSDGHQKEIKNLIKKLGFLKAFFEEFHGKNMEDWFKIFDIEGSGAIRFYEIKWTLKTFMNQYISDNQIRAIYNSLDKDHTGGVHSSHFQSLFNPEEMKQRLQNYYRNNSHHPHEVNPQEVKMRQYPIMIMNPITSAMSNPHSSGQSFTVERPNTQDSVNGRRGSFNLRYFKRKSSAQQVQGKSFELSVKSSGKQLSMNQTCHSKMYINPKKQSRAVHTSHTEASSQSPDRTLLQQYFKQQNKQKRRVTNATILRKKFIYEEILPRQRKLQQQRFRTVPRRQAKSQILGVSINL